MITVKIQAAKCIDHTYDVMITEDVADDINTFIEDKEYYKAFLITDSNIEKLYAQDLKKKLKINTQIISFKAGEKSKSRKTKAMVEDQLLEFGAGRDCLLIAMGGGVTTDMTGFVAATFKRGIDYINIPTSLLAMTDASLGGKVAIDTKAGKNTVGAFHHPKRIVFDLRYLATLPIEHYKSAIAEMIKIAAIKDELLFGKLEQNASDILCHSSLKLKQVVSDCIMLKAKVVSDDSEEQSERKILNFGHTVGHGIEKASDYKLSHGEAISIGMVAESELSVKEGYLEEKDRERLLAVLKLYGLPICLPSDLDIDVISENIKQDKKKMRGFIESIYLERIGKIVSVKGKFSFKVAPKMLKEVIELCKI